MHPVTHLGFDEECLFVTPSWLISYSAAIICCLRRKAWPFSYLSYVRSLLKLVGKGTWLPNTMIRSQSMTFRRTECPFSAYELLASINLMRWALAVYVSDASAIETGRSHFVLTFWCEEVDLVANIAASVNICSNKSSETICLTETVAPNLIAQCKVPRFWLSFSFSFRKQRTRFFFLGELWNGELGS